MKKRVEVLQNHLLMDTCPPPPFSSSSSSSSSSTSASSGGAYVVGARRTPVGSYGGALSAVGAVELGAAACRAALEGAGVPAKEVEEVVWGNVVSAGLGQAPAHQVAQAAGCAEGVVTTSVNKVCASGMKATMLGAMMIECGQRDVVLVGGSESMSNCPHYVSGLRFGVKYGDSSLVDGLQLDGLQDPASKASMGEFAERLAEREGFTREAQDEYAAESYRRALQAQGDGKLEAEIVPVTVRVRGRETVVSVDEEPARGDPTTFGTLRTPFRRDGTVTAATSSPLSDGGAALVLVSRRFLDRNPQVKPLGRIVSYGDASQIPELFTTSPRLAAQKALERAHLAPSDISRWEVNEAFANVAQVFIRDMELDHARVNVYGGAVAIGHPIGCSGARILVTLLNVLAHEQQEEGGEGRFGCAAICNGGGGASSVVLQCLSPSLSAAGQEDVGAK